MTIGSGGSDNLFVSNGYPLDDINCRFEHVYDSATGKTPGNDDLLPPGEGFSQLYWDETKKMLVSVGGSYDDGRQRLSYQYFTLKRSEAGNIYRERETAVNRDFATTSGDSAWPGPSLRYGGGLRPFGTSYQVVLVPRTLTGGAGMNYMEIDIYPTSTPAP